ncbi:MAG TPA: sialate O-acetylesterase [Phycisphaerae bacterium]|nr:sialate O-acetylesterase [Phycisphaerae bacterium]
MTTTTKRLLSVVVLMAVVAVAAVQPAEAGQAGKSPVKVFILAGQSNMEGAGAIKGSERNGGKGSLEYLVKDPATAKQFAHTVDKDGKWVVRDDVWIWYLGRKGGLTAGYGARSDRIGPEFQFGHVMGDACDNQVLLIKTAWGGKSLAKDFRPPSSGGEVGPFYTEMLKHLKDVLADLKTHFPDYDGKGYEIAGFGWHQGWNDGCGADMVAEYETNMANFIRDVRKALGVKDLPFVIADSGFGGRNQKVDRRLGIRKAQAAVARYPEFKGTVFCVETQDYFRPPEESPSRQGYHWNGNAETYFLIGNGMGEAMKSLAAAGTKSIAGKARAKTK